METRPAENSLAILKQRRLPLFLGMGVLSGLLYSSGIGIFLFLMPAAVVTVNRGFKEGVQASVTALAVIAAGMAWRLGALGFQNITGILLSLVPVAILLACMTALALQWGTAWLRLLVVTAVATIAFGFMFRSAFGTADSIAFMTQVVAAVLANAGISSQEAQSVAQIYVERTIRLVWYSYAAVLWAVFAGSLWVASRVASVSKDRRNAEPQHAVIEENTSAGLSLTGSDAEERAPAIARVTVPRWMLWPALLSWALLLAILYGKLHGALAAIAWNAALLSALAYGIQGWAIIVFFLSERGFRKGAGLVPALMILAFLLDRKIGLSAAILLPSLGVMEVWSQYRTRKGA